MGGYRPHNKTKKNKAQKIPGAFFSLEVFSDTNKKKLDSLPFLIIIKEL